jgi:hypothetical protein
MHGSSHNLPPEPPRVIPRSRYHAPVCPEIAIIVSPQSHGVGLTFRSTICNVISRQTTNQKRSSGLVGAFGIDFRQHDAPLGRWRADRSESARGDHGRSLRASPTHADSGKETSDGRSTDALTYPFTTNPHAEGRRARAAGLTEAENPYLWPPGAREDWAAGWMGEGL